MPLPLLLPAVSAWYLSLLPFEAAHNSHGSVDVFVSSVAALSSVFSVAASSSSRSAAVVGVVSLVFVGDTSFAYKRLLRAGLSQRFSNLCFSDVLISLVCYTFVAFKSFCVQLWQLDGLMSYISIHPVDRVLSDVYYPRSSMLEIRDTSNAEVLIKGSLTMLRIVNCALAAVSISGFISQFVVFNSQGFVSLFSSMVVEFRGLLYVIGFLSVVFAPIFICCICFLVIVVSLAMMAMLSCSVNTFSILGE
ncbi:hypothetical protein Bca4012_050346 [Brassica carinata]